jgi:hypothetical protein
MFKKISENIEQLVVEWEQKLITLSEEQITLPKNSQNRSIKQILGHMIDSVSNNTHRVVHFQYRESPVDFPNYATFGNNDKWIAIQNYENENWTELVQLWKYLHLHFCHVIQNIKARRLETVWLADKDIKITLKEMVEDFPRHFDLHIFEIEDLILNRK